MSTALDLAPNLYTAEDLERLSAEGHRYELIESPAVCLDPLPKPLFGARDLVGDLEQRRAVALNRADVLLERLQRAAHLLHRRYRLVELLLTDRTALIVGSVSDDPDLLQADDLLDPLIPRTLTAARYRLGQGTLFAKPAQLLG